MNVDGYELRRLLSDRERTKLFLAREVEGEWCAVKLQRPKESSELAKLVQRDAQLHRLSRHAGLLEILDSGQTEDGWAWIALTLADNLPGLPSLAEDGGLSEYTPLNLGAWLAIQGAPSAKQAAQWGIRLAKALGVLHDAGFVHRDVKPANILFVSGEPCLGDYELAGEPGERLDYRGTEGYRPVEGTNDAGADLFALGKTLYEAWTGANRLEFPSLPKSILQAPEWHKEGGRLNQVLCRACDAQPRKRFRSAEELSAALAGVVSSHQPVSRRRWFLTASVGTAVGLAALLSRKYLKAPARVTWRCLRKTGFNVESWAGSHWSADWARGKMYSFEANGRGVGNAVFQALDLRSFSVAEAQLGPVVAHGGSFLLHPQTHEFWILEGGNGRVFGLNPESCEVRFLGGEPADQRHYGAQAYWNPITCRVGVWGGYGMLRVTNSRHEFDQNRKTWIQLADDGAPNTPWRRNGHLPLIPASNGERLFLIGGDGSPSGVQNDRVSGVKGFNGRFHDLNDIWELDLKTDRWTCHLPTGQFEPIHFAAATYFPHIQGLLIFEETRHFGDHHPSTCAWLFRPGVDRRPVKLPADGEVPGLFGMVSYTLDPSTEELLLFSPSGIFQVAVEPS